MFITKTIDESVEQFDLIDSICESYEDLIQLNDNLAHLDIKEQELIHTESADLDAFREDAMDKAKNMISVFLSKLKEKYYKFLKWVNVQIIKLFKQKLDKYFSKNKNTLEEALEWFKNSPKLHMEKANPISKYLHKAVVKDDKIVPLGEFINGARMELRYFIFTDMGSENAFSSNTIKRAMKVNLLDLYKKQVEEKVGKFTSNVSGDVILFPVSSFNDFNNAISEIMKITNDENDLFKATEEHMKKDAESETEYNEACKYYNWRYTQFTILVNAYISMCRTYFMSCVLSASSIVNAYENAQKQ